jgi:hypothetical protein
MAPGPFFVASPTVDQRRPLSKRMYVSSRFSQRQYSEGPNNVKNCIYLNAAYSRNRGSYEYIICFQYVKNM